MMMLLIATSFFDYPMIHRYLCNTMKEDKLETNKRKKTESGEEQNGYDNFELEFKMMENQMYSWLISSAYPQVDTKAGRNRNRNSGTQKQDRKRKNITNKK